MKRNTGIKKLLQTFYLYKVVGGMYRVPGFKWHHINNIKLKKTIQQIIFQYD